MDISPKVTEKILHLCPEGVIGNDREGNIFLFNTVAERILGYTCNEVTGKIGISRLFPAGWMREVQEAILSEGWGGRGQLRDYETEAVSRTGKRIPILLACTLVRDEKNRENMILFFSDFSDRKTLRERLIESEEKYRSIVETAKDAILSIDEDWKILMANPAVEEVLGYHAEELVGMDIRLLLPPRFAENWNIIQTYTSPKATASETGFVELSAVRKSGGEIPVQVSLSESRAHARKSFTAILRDISERKAYEEELRIFSITDSLTGLYNRRHFYSLAQKELERAVRKKVTFCVLLIDIDHFKKYNDAYGHQGGDLILKEIADLMRNTFRLMDSCFRFGGEEFLVLLPETDEAGARIASERFRSLLAGKEIHIAISDTPVKATASIGIAEYREGCTVDDMVRFADLSMYAAKNAGRNRIVDYEQVITRRHLNNPGVA
jgi:diguanylate cyclase (GGDEF)-like protein/PAS domain S-box-containing protein